MGENHLLQYVSIFFQIRNSFYNDFVLVQSFTNTQAATHRELQLSLVFQSLLEGSYNPLLLFFQGPLFINFQTGSNNNIEAHNQTTFWITQSPDPYIYNDIMRVINQI